MVCNLRILLLCVLSAACAQGLALPIRLVDALNSVGAHHRDGITDASKSQGYEHRSMGRATAHADTLGMQRHVLSATPTGAVQQAQQQLQQAVPAASSATQPVQGGQDSAARAEAAGAAGGRVLNPGTGQVIGTADGTEPGARTAAHGTASITATRAAGEVAAIPTGLSVVAAGPGAGAGVGAQRAGGGLGGKGLGQRAAGGGAVGTAAGMATRGPGQGLGAGHRSTLKPGVHQAGGLAGGGVTGKVGGGAVGITNTAQGMAGQGGLRGGAATAVGAAMPHTSYGHLPAAGNMQARSAAGTQLSGPASASVGAPGAGTVVGPRGRLGTGTGTGAGGGAGSVAPGLEGGVAGKQQQQEGGKIVVIDPLRNKEALEKAAHAHGAHSHGQPSNSAVPTATPSVGGAPHGGGMLAQAVPAHAAGGGQGKEAHAQAGSRASDSDGLDPPLFAPQLWSWAWIGQRLVAPLLAAGVVALASLLLLCYWSGSGELLKGILRGRGPYAPLFQSRSAVVDLQAWPSRLVMAGRHVMFNLGAGRGGVAS